MRQFSLILTLFFCLMSVARAESEAPVVSTPDVVAPSKADEVLLYAMTLTGTNYKFGGHSTESGFDCSGFVGYVFKEVAGMVLPRDTRGISKVGNSVDKTELKPGDLVFFNTLRRTFSHVGIYLGDNRFIHASSSKTGDVMVSDMTEKYWSKRFNGARRLALASE